MIAQLLAFADTSFFIAAVNPQDEYHRRAVSLLAAYPRIVSTAWVVSEFLAYFAVPPHRQRAIRLVDRLTPEFGYEILPATHHEYRAGLALYRDRPDKHWSLVDCISFAIMRERGLAAALTGDRHFEQAGFRALLRD